MGGDRPPLCDADRRRVDARVNASPGERRSVTRWLGLVLGVVGIGALGWYVADALSAGVIVVERLAIGPLIGAFASLAAGYAAQATAWHRLMRGQGTRLGWAQDAARWATSLLGKYLPGKVFHAVGRVYVYRREADEAAVTAAFAAEFVLGMSAAAVAALIGLAIAPLTLPFTLRAGLWAGAALGLVATFAGIPDRIVAWLAHRVMRRRIAPIARGATRAVAFVWSLVGYLMMGTGLLFLADSLAPVAASLWPACVAAYCLSGILGVLAFFVPAGLGVRDVALAGLLGVVVPAPLAASIALAARCWITVGELVAVTIGAAATRRRTPEAVTKAERDP